MESIYNILSNWAIFTRIQAHEQLQNIFQAWEWASEHL